MPAGHFVIDRFVNFKCYPFLKGHILWFHLPDVLNNGSHDRHFDICEVTHSQIRQEVSIMQHGIIKVRKVHF